MQAGWKTLDTQNNSLAIDHLLEDDLDDQYYTDAVMRPIQVIYWPNFVNRRRSDPYMCIISIISDSDYVIFQTQPRSFTLLPCS